jgi:hypothetical protein
VDGEGERAVDVPTPQIARDPLVIAGALRPQQHQLDVACRQLPADPPYLLLEERVGEHPELGLRDDHRDRTVAAGDQGAGRVIGHVVQFLDRPPHLLDQCRAYARAPVDDPGGRRTGHTGACRDGFQRRTRPHGLLGQGGRSSCMRLRSLRGGSAAGLPWICAHHNRRTHRRLRALPQMGDHRMWTTGKRTCRAAPRGRPLPSCFCPAAPEEGGAKRYGQRKSSAGMPAGRPGPPVPRRTQLFLLGPTRQECSLRCVQK